MFENKSLSKTVLTLGAASIAGLHGINRYISYKASTSKALNTDAGLLYQWKHGNVYYNKYGNGSFPLFLLHDCRPYSSGFEWHVVIPYLEKLDYTIYVVDLPGCGRSDKPAIEYTSYLYIQFITGFIKDVIGEPAYIAATGLSSSFSVMSSISDPALFRGLFLINPPSLNHLRRVPNQHAKMVGRIIQLPVIGTCIYHFLTSRKNMEYLLNENYFYNPFLVKNREVEAYYQSAHLQNSDGKYLRASIDNRMIYWNIDRALSSMQVPVTAIFGEHLPHAKEISKEYRHLCTACKCVFIPHAKMIPQMEVPASFANILRIKISE